MKKWNVLASLGLLLALTLAMDAQGAFLGPTNPIPTVTLAWNASPTPDVTGYNIYYGVGTRAYTNKVTLANVTTAVIPLPARGVQFFFTATAYSPSGLESDFSNEVTYTAPAVPFAPGTLRTNAVQLAVNIESSPDPTGPWQYYGSLGTNLVQPAFYRSSLEISKAEPLHPVPVMKGLKVLASPKSKI